MKCAVQSNTLEYLVKEKYITDVREIINGNIDSFNIINKKLTEHAKSKYGLMPAPDELLFKVDIEKHKKFLNTKGKNYISDASYNILYRAVPNDLLFDALQDCVNNYEAKNERILNATQDFDIDEVDEVYEKTGLNFEFSSAYGNNGYNLNITKDGVKVGTLNYDLEGNVATVGAVTIDEGYKRLGLATEAYIILGDSLANKDVTLRSGKLNSLSKGLWNKLVDQGKAQMIDKNVYEYIPSKNKLNEVNINTVPEDVFDKDLAKKIQAKLQKLYPEINLKFTNVPILPGEGLFNQTATAVRNINYRLKVADTLVKMSEPQETKRTRKYDEITEAERVTLKLNSKEQPNIETNIRKTLARKGVSSEQIDYIFDYMKSRNIQEIKVADLAIQLMEQYQFAAKLMNIEKPPYKNLTINAALSDTSAEQGENYKVTSIDFPEITPNENLRSHENVTTRNSVGWFRSDEVVDNNLITLDVLPAKIMRIQEVQSDHFQRARRQKAPLINDIIVNQKTKEIFEYFKSIGFKNIKDGQMFKVKDTWFQIISPYNEQTGKRQVLNLKNNKVANISGQALFDAVEKNNSEAIQYNQINFLNLLLEKDRWVKFFMKTIMQEAAEKGFDYVRFPTGDTIVSIESSGRYQTMNEARDANASKNLIGTGNFYENKLNDNLYKTYGKDAKLYRDSEGISWIQIAVNNSRDLSPIMLQQDKDRIIGQANIKALSVLIDAVYQKQDTLPHEYAHHYIAWYRNTPIVQEAIKKWGSEEALVQAIGEQVVAQEGEAYNWWKKFMKWILNNFNGLSKLDKDRLSKILTDAFLTRTDLNVNLGSQQATQGELMFLRLDPESSQKARANEVAEILAERLAANLKTSYKIISQTEASEILKNRVTPYNGEPAFFFAGVIYFVGDNFNLETALHEFGHPLIGAIRVENGKLFNNLFMQVQSTTEGQEIIAQVEKLYPELATDSPLFMEEVIVHALQKSAYNKVTNTPESGGFVNFIKNLLYNIKQIFRSFFSNTQNISKINESTTLEELADMMLSKDFEYQTELVTNEDIAMFSRYTKSRVKVLTKNASENVMQSAIDNFYASTVSMLNSAKKFSKKSNLYPMLEKTLFIEGSNELLPAIKKSLAPYQSIVDMGKASKDEIIESVIEAELRRIKDMTNKSINFVSSLEITNNIIKSIYTDLLQIQQDKNFGERSTLSVLGIYRSNLSSWSEFIDDTTELFKEDFNLQSDNSLSNLLNEMASNARSAVNLLQKIYKESSVDFYRTYTAYMQEFLDDKLKKDLGNALKSKLTADEIEDFYNKIITGDITDEDMAKLLTKGVEKKYINDFISEYNSLKIDELKIRDLLSGNAKDVSWFNRFLESYTSSNDPIVGGLAMYIQNIKTDAQLKTLNETEVFRGKLQPLLNANNVNPNNTTQLAELVANRDKVLGFDEQGKPVEKEVFTLKNEWKNYRYVQEKLRHDYNEALKTNDKQQIADAAAALRQFKKDYMYDKYTKVVLDADDIFNQSAVHRLAWLTRKQALEDYNSELSTFSTELERFEQYSSAQALWRKYQQLYELNYIDGSPKIDDPENNIYDLSIALILREHKEKTSEFYESIPREGSLQTSYNEFVNSVDAKGVSKEEAAEMKNKWIKQNTRIAYSESYYARKKELITRLKELQDKKVEQSDFNISEAYTEIYDLLFSFRDSQGQPIPSELKAERIEKIRVLQQKINDVKFAEQKASKLTKEQTTELSEYVELIKAKKELSDEQKLRYLKLIKVNTPEGLSALEAAEIQGIYNELAEISSKIPTEYYMESLNYYLTQVLGQEEAQESDIDDLINSDSFKDLLVDNEKFRNWFFNNHVTKKRYSKTGSIDVFFERLACYSVSVPNNEDDYVKTKLIDPVTGKEFTVNGLPNARHCDFRIKNDPKYRTIPIGDDKSKYIGTIIDNAGNYLPRPYNPGAVNSAKDDMFVDQEFLRLKQADNAQYKLIQTIKEYYIKFQENAAYGSRLWYDLPRYGKKGVLENLQAGALSNKAKALKGSWDYYWQKMIGKSNDDYELGLNYDASKNLVTTDMQGNEISYIPVTGTYNLDIEKTSKDFLPGIFQYIQSINMQSKLIESSPLINSILSVLEDPKNSLKNVNKQSRTIQKVKGKLVNANKNKGDVYNRLEQVRSLIERELYGRKIVGIEESNPWLHKMSNFMLSAAGRATLAINIPSDLKNRYGQIVQNLIEASGGKYVSLKSMAIARPWAAKAMVEWSSVGIYARGNQTINNQIIQSFDPFFKTEDQFGKNISRTRAKDMLDGSWMYSFRKFGEMEAAMQLFGGFMHHQYVDQVSSDGKVVPIRYIDAWELDENGVLKLKAGIDPEWGNKTIYHTVEAGDTLESIAKKYSVPLEDLKAKNRISGDEYLTEGKELVIAQSAKFKKFKNRFQTVSRRLYGAYDDFGQAEGNKYFIYRMFFFMRKWATSMFTNRFAADLSKENRWGRRYDWGLGETSRGYYISGIASLYKLVKSAGKYYPYMSEEDKIDTRKMISEGVSIFLFSVMGSLLFGYDPDDEERWEKIKRRSDALGTEGFKANGWVANHMLNLLLQVGAETSAFVPLPGLGLDDYNNFISVTSTSFKSTLTVYAQILEDLFNMAAGNDAAYYKLDSGPYSWQKEGEAKIKKHLLRTIGISGGTGDVESLIKNYERYSSKI